MFENVVKGLLRHEASDEFQRVVMGWACDEGFLYDRLTCLLPH